MLRNHIRQIAAAATLAILAGSACGQDSVSRNANGGSGLPGDGLTHWATTSQKTNFIVDLAPLHTSWGTTFGVAPILKSGRATSGRFSSTNLSSSISSDVRIGVAYPAASYTLWTAPGGGVNITESNAALNSSVPRTGNATVFGVGFMDVEETGTGTSAVFTNQVIGGLVAFDPAEPTRLYVSRTIAANNNTTATAADTAQFGYGAVDAAGNIVFRADGFGVLATASQITADSLFRVRLASRTNAVNTITSAGGSDAPATDRLLNNDTVTHNVPGLIPASLGSRSVAVTPNLLSQLRAETAANATTTSTTHRAGAAEHRGAVTVLARPLFAGSVATGAVLARPTISSRTTALSVFGLDAAGATTSARLLNLPAGLNDSCTSYTWPMSSAELRSYDSQVTFRGGGGPVALAQDAQGNALAAATVYNGGILDADNPFNAIAVARFDPANPNSPVTWTLAAWVDSAAMTGKSILGDVGLDGAPGTSDTGEGDGVINASDAPVGRLAAMLETSLGVSGPSMSSPAMDSAGNVYFLASARINRWNGTQVVAETKLALLRAVYDAAAFCYSLELVCQTGDVFAGPNSGRNYKLVTLNVADSDSVSSASIWSGSANAFRWNNDTTSPADPISPQSLGGLVLSARILYDVNADGLYEDPTTVNGNAASVDEAYNVVLYVGNTTPAGCPADWDHSGGVDGDDVIAFFSQWDQSNADYNGDGGTDGDDVIAFFGDWDSGC